MKILANWPLERLIGFWLGMIVVFGLIYWLAGISMGWGFQAGNLVVKPDLDGLNTAIYFSFVTALSIGYGDVTPMGALRIFAVIEGIAGLLAFGCVISKLVSRRQEELTAEIHRTTFEDRLDRVRTNRHLVFADFGTAPVCAGVERLHGSNSRTGPAHRVNSCHLATLDLIHGSMLD